FGLLENPLTWQDTNRAPRIAVAFRGPDQDVAGVQEVWNAGLWGAIRTTSGYAYSFYGDRHGKGLSLPLFGYVDDFLHSGLGLLSRHPMSYARQEIYDHEVGMPEALSAKSFIEARVVKENIGVGIFMTHLQAGPDTEKDILVARGEQVIELVNAVAA